MEVEINTVKEVYPFEPSEGENKILKQNAQVI